MYGFPRSARLLNGADFQKVFKKSKKIHTRSFTIYVHATSGMSPRIGLAVSKKVLPKAVDRNRTKRVVRDSFRRNRWRFSSCDVIFVARKEHRGFTNVQLFEDLDGVWNKLVNFSVS
ncbi:MAG: ribonuclease P protein component, partial [Gammaproteobacteria bacterium]|nr:ribonuclease P protein component [Gammaproteobacteria bacterium]